MPTAARRLGDADGCCVAALADGSIATVTRNGVLAILPPDGSKARKLTKPSTDIKNMYALAVAPTGPLVAYAGNGITVWNASTRDKLYKLKDLAVPALSRDGALLAARSRNAIFLANATDGTALREVAPDWAQGEGAAAAIHGFAFSPDGQQLAVGGEYGKLRLFGLTEASVIETLQVRPTPTGPLSSVAWSSAGQLACAGWGTGVHLRSPSGHQLDLDCAAWLGDEWPRDPGDSAGSTAVCFSPDETLLLSAFDARGRLPGKASWATLWDVASGRDLARLVFADTVIRAVAFTPDGTGAVLGCSSPLHRPFTADDGVWLWPVER